MNYYDSIANSYDSLYKEEQLSKWECLKGLVDLKGLVLDAGCGTGFITRKISNVVGVDSSINLLKKCSGLRVVLGSLENLPFRSESFDAVVSFTVLQDVSNISAVVKEIKRVLKPEGIVLLSVLNKNKASIIRKVVKKEFKSLKEKNVGKDVVFYTKTNSTSPPI